MLSRLFECVVHVCTLYNCDILSPINTQYAYNSYLYWTNRSVNDGYGEAIHKMSLYDLNSVQTIDIGQRRIEKLTLDSPFLYWIDRRTEGAHKIERINLNGTNSKLNVTEIATFANNVTGV